MAASDQKPARERKPPNAGLILGVLDRLTPTMEASIARERYIASFNLNRVERFHPEAALIFAAILSPPDAVLARIVTAPPAIRRVTLPRAIASACARTCMAEDFRGPALAGIFNKICRRNIARTMAVLLAVNTREFTADDIWNTLRTKDGINAAHCAAVLCAKYPDFKYYYESFTPDIVRRVSDAIRQVRDQNKPQPAAEGQEPRRPGRRPTARKTAESAL